MWILITGMCLGIFTMLAIFFLCLRKSYKNYSLIKLTKKLGQTAETIINNDISTWAKHTKNKYLKASLYKYNENKLFEVDGILITSRGIAVVEIKSIKGEVIGDGKKQKWIKKIGNKKFGIINPIIQNDKHIEHIMNIMNAKVPIFSLIIYSNRTESIKITNKPEHVVIIRHAELYSTLDHINKSLELKMTETQVMRLYKRIKSYKTNKVEDIKLHHSFTKNKQTTK